MFVDTPTRTPRAQPGEKHITTAELAARLRLKRNTIEHWRQHGRGPAFVRIEGGGIRYDEAVVAAWIEQRTHTSTAEYEPHQIAPSLLQRAA